MGKDYIEEAFGINGHLSKSQNLFKYRGSQVKMANAIDDAFNSQKHSIIEAPTGIGKTFAYLIPAIQFALYNEVKVLISTKTKNLQSQIIDKDIPLLEKALPYNFKAAKVFGMGNYFCLHRFEKFKVSKESSHLDDEINEIQKKFIKKQSDRQSDPVSRIKAITDESEADEIQGLKSEIDVDIANDIWTSVNAESDSCHRKKCKFYEDCYYYKAKEKLKKADILVINHALFFADLAVRKSMNFKVDSVIFPKFDAIIFDEAHDIENVATNFLGRKISNFRLKHFTSSFVANINNNMTLRKAINSIFVKKAGKIIEKLNVESKAFFSSVEDYLKKEITLRIRKPNFVNGSGLIRTLEDVKNCLVQMVRDIGGEISKDKIVLTSIRGNESDIKDIETFFGRTKDLINDLSFIISQSKKDWVYWAGKNPNSPRVEICTSPINIKYELADNLFARHKTVVLTSATLSVNNSFDFISERIGLNLNNAIQVILDSPFKYDQQAILCVPEDCVEPNHKNIDIFVKRIVKQIKEVVKLSHGRCFILFTSYKLMNDCYKNLEDILEDWGYPVFKQRPGYPADKLLSQFLENKNSILFGAESFWQGVDVPGDALSCVIIPKLPFGNPSEPIVEARLEFIKRRRANPFMTYSLPESVLRLKQGTGRLIRTETDKGAIVILDNRVITKGYGSSVVNSLPNYWRTRDINQLSKIFEN